MKLAPHDPNRPASGASLEASVEVESGLVPYAAQPLIPCRSAIVLAPHADDEVFGCGGSLALHVAAGHRVEVVILSDGAFGRDGAQRVAYAARRQDESAAAAAILGYREPSAWRLPDRAVEYGEGLVDRIAGAIRESEADLVYAPSLHEAHPDHRAVAMATVEAVRRIGGELRLAFFEIGVPLRPNLLLDITSVQAKKLHAMRCFVSQLERQRYDEQIDALNRYRALTLPPAVRAAEAFELVSAADIARNHLAMFASEYRRLRQQGVAADGPADLPLVSVIVRSMGRPVLADALDSVMLQTYPNVEVVLVNALGPTHADPGDRCGRFPLRFISPGQPLRRSRAGNVGMDLARGDYLIFLDDDDWLLPDHLSALVKTLQRHPQTKVAYTGAACADENGNPVVKTFRHPFDRTRFLAGNFIPIHTAMFTRSVIESGCRLDETLDLYEDWDFWLQVSCLGDFVFVDQMSAVYRIGALSGQGSQPNAVPTKEPLKQLLTKWRAQWRPEDLWNLTNRVVEHERQAADLEALTQKLDLQQQQQQVLHMQHDSLQVQHDSLQVQHSQLLHQHQELQQYHHAMQQQHDQLLQQHFELQRQNQALDQHSEALQQQLALQQAEIHRLGDVRLLHLQQLADIHQSFSWRITRPLRGTRRMVDALRRHLSLRLLANLPQPIGGEISRHGVAGFARRLPRYLRNSRTYLAILASRPTEAGAGLFSSTGQARREIRLHPDLEGGGDSIDTKISVVIPTLNAGQEFAWLLRKLNGQRGVRAIEIVIVDSGSNDETVRLAREAGAKIIEIPQAEFSHSYARNRGADAASGDYLLFMVQDAYPIGDYWMHGMLRFLLDHAHDKLVAVSCAECSRSDSDMMYDSMINTHYRFLGCSDFDRIGEFRGDDHMALRSQGQLSDVSCLIGRECFSRYRYRGNYAEDLDLGIRLIKDGWRVAMLSSVKVVHSHNRPAYYYLKRSFVDVVFLVGLFDDFAYPRCQSLAGLLTGLKSTAAHVSAWLQELETSASDRFVGEQLDGWIRSARKEFADLRHGQPACLGDDRLDEFVNSSLDRFLGAAVPPSSFSFIAPTAPKLHSSS